MDSESIFVGKIILMGFFVAKMNEIDPHLYSCVKNRRTYERSSPLQIFN